MQTFKQFINEPTNAVDESLGSTLKSIAASAMLSAGSAFGGQHHTHNVPVKKHITQNVRQDKVGQTKVDLNKLRQAIIKTESLGEKDPDSTIGDNNRAFGRYQIHKIAVDDVNAADNTNYKHSDMFDPVKATDVFNRYMALNTKRYINRTNKQPTYEVLARMWNGGPMGWKNNHTILSANTKNYWKRVKQHLYSSGVLSKK